MKKHSLAVLIFVFAASCTPVPPSAPAPLAPIPTMPGPPHWVQLGDHGQAELRTVVENTTAHCPTVRFDDRTLAMQVRAAADEKFALLCAAPILANTRHAWLGDVAIPLPVAMPHRILVLGDTGCRLKGAILQACNDPRAWPFPVLAAAAARMKPDMVIDVGDYQYRESPCPPGNAGCAGTPFGDNWPTWKADFFTPAAPLLATAPWIMTRGNHEDCQRAGPGYLRLLGPAPVGDCAAHLAPLHVTLGDLNLVVMDDASASDTDVDQKSLPTYAAELANLHNGGRAAWLVLHRPIWAAISGPLNLPVGGNVQLITAAGDGLVKAPVELMLSGHIHAFEALNYDSGVPPQIVAGHGGDNLDPVPANLKGTIFQGHSGVNVLDGLSVPGFGFLMLTREAPESKNGGWEVALYDSNGAPERVCHFVRGAGGKTGRVDCPPK